MAEIYKYTGNQIGGFILFGMLLGFLMTMGVSQAINNNIEIEDAIIYDSKKECQVECRDIITTLNLPFLEDGHIAACELGCIQNTIILKDKLD